MIYEYDFGDSPDFLMLSVSEILVGRLIFNYK